MKVKICLCKQCRASKKKVRGNAKKRIKRLINKKRRRGNDDKVYCFYYA